MITDRKLDELAQIDQDLLICPNCTQAIEECTCMAPAEPSHYEPSMADFRCTDENAPAAPSPVAKFAGDHDSHYGMIEYLVVPPGEPMKVGCFLYAAPADSVLRVEDDSSAAPSPIGYVVRYSNGRYGRTLYLPGEQIEGDDALVPVYAAPAAPAHEPVAWKYEDTDTGKFYFVHSRHPHQPKTYVETPLYDAPVEIESLRQEVEHLQQDLDRAGDVIEKQQQDNTKLCDELAQVRSDHREIRQKLTWALESLETTQAISDGLQVKNERLRALLRECLQDGVYQDLSDRIEDELK